ncbi:hypothetical protein [Paraburkholderia sp. MM6662-R1]|uniref:hypothetical protein n=1 Tax=Paraburkholderia sp. MM6662-R1 TaxID=2991066 RepID=UPI003D20B7AE
MEAKQMAWFNSGSFTTAAAKQTLYWTTTFGGALFNGPIAVAANFEGGDENFGDLTAGNITVSAVEGNSSEPDAYYPVSFSYSFPIVNDSPWPLAYNLAIGTFS